MDYDDYMDFEALPTPAGRLQNTGELVGRMIVWDLQEHGYSNEEIVSLDEDQRVTLLRGINAIRQSELNARYRDELTIARLRQAMAARKAAHERTSAIVRLVRYLRGAA